VLKRCGIMLATVLLTGCNTMRSTNDTADITLRTQPETAAAGARVELILENRSSADVGYNLCTSALERVVNGSGQPVPSDRACTLELRILTPAQTARYTIALPAALTAGEYRWVTRVERMSSGDMVSVTSNTFRVQG
jgi:hypothetical protein